MNNLTLDQRLSYIGVQLTGPQRVTSSTSSRRISRWIDIETTLHEASLEVPNDSRLFSLLCSWVSIHGDYVVIEKLMKLQKKKNSPWLVALAICALNMGFHRWK